jgi:hypothetical protein
VYLSEVEEPWKEVKNLRVKIGSLMDSRVSGFARVSDDVILITHLVHSGWARNGGVLFTMPLMHRDP